MNSNITKIALEFIKKHTSDTVFIAIATVVLVFANGQENTEIKNQFADAFVDTIWLEINQENMRAHAFDMQKQDEKLSKDPDDIKLTDLAKFDYLCNSRYGTHYIPTLPIDQEKLARIRCEKLSALYIERMQ
jgi:hypothetical protein